MLFLTAISLLSTRKNHNINHHHNFLNLLPITLIISLVSHSIHSNGVCSKLNHDSLASFNLSIATLSPLNWSLSVDCCSWEGVGCDESGRVTSLSLPSRGLTGSIPPSITNITSLKILSLPDNKLTGMIPRDVGRLSELEQFHLHTNQLNGTIPSSLANCTKLITLILRFNSLKGELSAFDFSKFVNLRLVDLGYNHFQGHLPPTLFSCKTLIAIRLTSNNITGQISPDIITLKSLSFLSLADNNLSNMTNAITILAKCKNLTTLMLRKNFYDETIPDDPNLIGPNGFQNLKIIGFDGSRLTGRIPMWLSGMQKLEAIDLSHNYITGSIPSWIGNLPNLFFFDFTDNLLTGEFPIAILELRRLAFPDSPNTTYNFELPVFSNPSNTSNLQYNIIINIPRGINLANNCIGGSIPSDIGRLKSINQIDLINNKFSGKIPDSISNLTNLEKLELSGNHLTGEIPSSLNKLHFLSKFSVAYNDLEGPIPTGGQFDTFPRSSFEGNPGLCGGIWLRPCPSFKTGGHEVPKEEDTQDEEEGVIINWVGFAIGFGLSFIVAIAAALKFSRCSARAKCRTAKQNSFPIHWFD